MQAVPASMLLLGVLVALAPVPSTAQPIHRWVDAQGNVLYSGFPPPSAGATEAPAALPGPALPLGLEPVRETPPSADEMLDLCGLRAQLPALVRDVVTQLDGVQVDLGEPERSTMRSLARRAFDPARVYPLVRDEYERHSPPERRSAAAAWLRSPAGRRIVGVLREAAQQPGAAALSAFGAALQQRPPTPARLELVERLDWVSGRSELSADLVLAVQRGLALGLTRFLAREQRPRPGDLAVEGRERRVEVLAGVREPMRVRLLHLVRDLPDEDIRQYIEFESSPEARAHNRALHRGLTRALAIAAERTGTELARSRPGTAITPAR